MTHFHYTDGRDEPYIPEPPCTFCAHARRCKDERMCCYRFARYTGTKVRHFHFWRQHPETPSKELYLECYPDDVVEVDFPLPSFLKPQAE